MQIVSIISAAFMLMNVTVEKNSECEPTKKDFQCPNQTDVNKKNNCEPTKTKCTIPYLVSIQVKHEPIGYHACTGILILPDWVLTTAHCLVSEFVESLWVVTGVDNLGEAKERGQHLTADCYFIHNEYQRFGKSYQNDIALIHLERSADLDECTGLANLSLIRKRHNFKCNCTEAGWQAHEAPLLEWPIFVKPRVQLLTSKICKDEYKHIKLPSCCLCGKAVRKEEGFCEGDNGGILICRDKKRSVDVITGIMSWRDGCEKKSRPTIYTNIALYETWVKRTLARFEEDKCPCQSEVGMASTKRVCPTTTTLPPTTTTTTTTTTPPPTTTTTTTTTTPPPTTTTTLTPTTTSNPCPSETDTQTKRCPDIPNSTDDPCTIKTTTTNPCQTTTTTQSPCFTPSTTTIPPDNCTRLEYVKGRRSKRRHENAPLRSPSKINRWIDYRERKGSRHLP